LQQLPCRLLLVVLDKLEKLANALTRDSTKAGAEPATDSARQH